MLKACGAFMRLSPIRLRSAGFASIFVFVVLVSACEDLWRSYCDNPHVPPSHQSLRVLPHINIDVDAQDIPNDPKVSTALKLDPGESDWPPVVSAVGIECRGLSSIIRLHKKNYGIELRTQYGFDRDISLLGMPDESDWVLHGGGNDLSMVANVFAYDIYRSIFGYYAPRTRYVTLSFNNVHNGLYVLIEKIKRDSGRVAISKLDADDESENAISGGYILAIDHVNDYEIEWTTNKGSVFQYYYPDGNDITAAQMGYIRSYINDVEAALDSAGGVDDISDLVDTESLVDYIILNELSNNKDAYAYSVVFYKERGDDRLYFGPPWDYDTAFGNHISSRIKGLRIDDRIDSGVFWDLIWKHTFIHDMVAERWREVRAEKMTTATLHTMIDGYVDDMRGEQEIDFLQWNGKRGVLYPLIYFPESHADMIEYTKQWVADRAKWLDEYFAE